ncbi:MAG: CopG family transcriptional regulator [Burkholderiaceae bacterium]|nr:CopG family transcriptional regulator [Burkholderiaceae bacterium]
MELKTARLTLLIDPAKKAAFERLCASQDVTPSQVVRRLIREYLAAHGVRFVPSGLDAAEPEAKASAKGRGRKARPRGARSTRSKGPSSGGAR